MGFFQIQKVDPKAIKARSCATCGLYKKCNSPKMKPNGKGLKKILILGEGSGEVEDRKNKQWQGKIGRWLKAFLKDNFGIDLFEDCICLNAVNCRPTDEDGENRKPTSTEISCCRKRVIKAIKEHEPKIIIAFGGAAVESLIGDRWLKDFGTISKWRGWAIPDRYLNTRICPTFHPSHTRRSLDDGKDQVFTIFKQDIENALTYLDMPNDYQEDESQFITRLKDPVEISERLKLLCKIRDHILSFDYETTGLKPHLSRHLIVCMAIAVSNRECYAFPIHMENYPEIRRFLKSKRVWKSAFNMKFENNWSTEKFGIDVAGWKWDSMLASHALDNRAYIKSLKFQTYINFGVMGYDEEISPYLRAKDNKNANAFNRIMEYERKYGMDKILTYCGLDAIYENMLGQKQRIALGVEEI